jgi:hypothetical protein
MTPSAESAAGPLRKRSGREMNLGLEQLGRGELEAAIATLHRASQMDPSYFGPWFNLGLAYKRSRNWRAALDAFVAAWDRLPRDVSTDLYASVLWNIGIAASALQEWSRARWAWSQLGHDVSGGPGGPPSIPMGLAWVSEPGENALLAKRLDPVRARILSHGSGSELVPGTVVVHDGARVGAKVHNGEELPIFPVLAVLSER